MTIQLPMFNEKAVAGRIIDATCAIDYPHDCLEIQVLDDSTDETVEIAQDVVAGWASRSRVERKRTCWSSKDAR